ncbi:MAG: ABC transporter ATP-binding protein [Armatimonadetes bacterium]|nr:ABC transporter ATP-binding protein [Armatimonadota bacterium]
MSKTQATQKVTERPPDDVAIRISNVSVTFGSRQILKNVSLDIPRGHTLCVMGLSGVGKSTLVKSIMGFVKPQGGQIFVLGQDVLKLSEPDFNSLRMRIGMVFQSPALFDSMTIGDNVAFPLREQKRIAEEEIQRIVSEKLSLVDLEGMEHLFPNQLSGGMQKRASIARAIVTDADVILYDEPTTGLDPIISNVINDLIMSLQRQLGVTSVVITHDLGSAYKIANDIAFLYSGNIVEKGTPEAFKNSTNPYVVQFREGSVQGPIKV